MVCAFNKYLLTHLLLEILLNSFHKAIGVAQELELLFNVAIIIKKSSTRIWNLLLRVPKIGVINNFNTSNFNLRPELSS